jgi:hypothetical protein
MSGSLSNAMSGRLSTSNPIVTQASDSNAQLYGTQAGGGVAADAGVLNDRFNVEPGTVHNVGLTLSAAPTHMTIWDEATGYLCQAWLLMNGSFTLAAGKTDVTDQVARLIENDHEAHVMHTGNAAPQHRAPNDGEQQPTSASPQCNSGSTQFEGLKRGLHPSEEVIALLQCVSFEGFPDWGNPCRGQERHGECVLALIGPTSPVPDAQTPLVRVVFLYAGALVRNASSTEVERRAACTRFARAEWKCGREQENSVGSIHTYSQLLSIGTVQLDSTCLKKNVNSSSDGCALGFLCKVVACISVVWIVSYILIGIGIFMNFKESHHVDKLRKWALASATFVTAVVIVAVAMVRNGAHHYVLGLCNYSRMCELDAHQQDAGNHPRIRETNYLRHNPETARACGRQLSSSPEVSASVVQTASERVIEIHAMKKPPTLPYFSASVVQTAEHGVNMEVINPCQPQEVEILRAFVDPTGKVHVPQLCLRRTL